MQKAIYAALLIVILFATWGGYIGYRHHVDNEVIDAVVPAVKNTSLRVANALKLFTQPSPATRRTRSCSIKRTPTSLSSTRNIWTSRPQRRLRPKNG